MQRDISARSITGIRAGGTRVVRDAVRGCAIVAAAACLLAAVPARADPALPDPGYFALTEDAPAAADGVAAKHLYIFGVPYRWQSTLTWRYNDAGRPATLSKSELIAGIDEAAGQWMAACNVAIAHSASQPDTTTPAQTINGTAPSPNENVIGWGDLSLAPAGGANVSGVTFASNQNGKLIDADTTYSTRWVTDAATLQRIAVHEFGHALGLAHSNVERQVMSGPALSGNPGVPPTEYDGQPTLQADDIQGCLCLYGPGPANAGKGYLCELPSYRDFGAVALGATSAVQTVTLHNDSAATVTLGAIEFSTPDFQRTDGCPPGTTLGPGAVCSFGMVFAPAGIAGAREAMVHIAADPLGPYQFPVIGVATGAPPPNYQGLWWNAPAGSESGWGINFAHQGTIIFATWFTYDGAGKPWWLIAELRRTAEGVYTGPISSVSGPPFAAVPFPPEGSPGGAIETVVGTMTVTFADTSHGTLAYTLNGTSQTKPIVPIEFGPRPVCTWGGEPDIALATNYQDLWWNPQESGWGINFAHQGNIIFATWYTYDGQGQPMWLIAELRKADTGAYTGPVSTVTGPAFNAAPWTRTVETVVGAATVTFADGNAATFAYTVNGTAQSKTITRLIFSPPGTACQ